METEHNRLSVIQQQAAGKQARGGLCKVTLPEQQTLIAQISYVAEGVCSLCQELHTLLEVVVLHSGQVLRYEHRRSEIEAVLDLLDGLTPLAIPALQRHILMLSKQIRLALSQALLFARWLDEMQEHASRLLG